MFLPVRGLPFTQSSLPAPAAASDGKASDIVLLICEVLETIKVPKICIVPEDL